MESGSWCIIGKFVKKMTLFETPFGRLDCLIIMMLLSSWRELSRVHLTMADRYTGR